MRLQDKTRVRLIQRLIDELDLVSFGDEGALERIKDELALVRADGKLRKQVRQMELAAKDWNSCKEKGRLDKQRIKRKQTDAVCKVLNLIVKAYDMFSVARLEREAEEAGFSVHWNGKAFVPAKAVDKARGKA